MKILLPSWLLLICSISTCFAQVNEDFEDFELGPLDGQMGWTSEAGAEIVDTGNDIFGDRSIKAFNLGPNDGDYLLSPVFDGSGYGTISFDIQIDDLDPFAEYIVQTFFQGGNTQRLHFHPGGIMSLDRSIGTCLINDFSIGGTWNTQQVMRISWRFSPDPQGSVVALQEIRLNDEIIFSGFNHLGCGFDDEMDSFGIWSFGSFPANVTIDNVTFLPNIVTGDVNGDGTVNLLDVSPFVDLLTSGGFLSAADINGDGLVNLLDVQGFVELLST